MSDLQKPAGGIVERLLRRDKIIVTTAVGVLIALAGIYTVFGVGMNMTAVEMTGMARPIGAPMEMGASANWTFARALLTFAMWWVMMIAMMTPGAAPLLLLFVALKKQGSDSSRAALLSGFLLAGYLLAWGGFSVIATGLQWGLETLELSDGLMMTIKSRGFAGVVLIFAGLYQFSNLKHACLSHCRSPGQFLAAHNRLGLTGAIRLGVDHGIYCLGCCWILMALLFVGGVMNLYWIVGLTLYVLIEKFARRGDLIARATGAAMVLIGAGVIAGG